MCSNPPGWGGQPPEPQGSALTFRRSAEATAAQRRRHRAARRRRRAWARAGPLARGAQRARQTGLHRRNTARGAWGQHAGCIAALAANRGAARPPPPARRSVRKTTAGGLGRLRAAPQTPHAPPERSDRPRGAHLQAHGVGRRAWMRAIWHGSSGGGARRRTEWAHKRTRRGFYVLRYALVCLCCTAPA